MVYMGKIHHTVGARLWSLETLETPTVQPDVEVQASR